MKSDGYIRGGEKDYNYNTDNITRIVNITPKSISDETSDIEVFWVSDAHCFLMVNHTIYRYDTFGGYHHQLCLWDYDGNGIKDLVSYNTSGSGLSYMSVDIFDLTSFKGIQVITRMTLDEPEFSFECKNGKIYINISIGMRKEPDQWGRDLKVYVTPTAEDKKNKVPKNYVGGGKTFIFAQNGINNPSDAEINAIIPDAENNQESDLPFPI